MMGLECGREADRRGHSRKGCLAWRGMVVKQDTILAGKLLEGNRYEGANSTYYKDLVGSVDKSEVQCRSS